MDAAEFPAVWAVEVRTNGGPWCPFMAHVLRSGAEAAKPSPRVVTDSDGNVTARCEYRVTTYVRRDDNGR